MQCRSLKIILTLLSLSVYGYEQELSVLQSDDVLYEYDAMISAPVDTQNKLAAMYPKSVDQVESWLKAGIKLAQKEIAAIIAIPAQTRTFQNTVKAFDIARNKVDRLFSVVSLLACVSPEPEIQKAAQMAEAELEQFGIEAYLNPALYFALQEYQDYGTDKDFLNDEDRYVLAQFLEEFKRAGLHVSADLLSEVKRLKQEIAQLEHDYQVNMNINTSQIFVSLSELAGVNKNFVNALKKNGDLYILNTDAPTLTEIVTTCQVSATRKKMLKAFKNCAYPANDSILKEILKKRDELAKLLGYKNFASFDIEDTMAKTVDTVETFLEKMISASLQKAEQELTLLKQNLPEGVVCNADGTLNPWDYPYALESYKKKHFQIDESKIAEYLPVQKVIDGIFAVYQNFLGLTFKEVKPEWSWHEDVRLIEIYHTKTGEFFGYIFLDLYPRLNKFKHKAACAPQVYSSLYQGKNVPAVSAIIANFSKPCGDLPALLPHDDVVVFFHEFGHAMHLLLGRTRHNFSAGTHVKQDFVEMPSQMFEEWMFEPKILGLISSHYQTGESLPVDLIAKKIALKQFDSGCNFLRISIMSLFALQMMQDGDISYQPDILWHQLHEKYCKTLFSFDPEQHFYASWIHVAHPGYASKYYSYLWARVLALDVFSKVKQQEFNKESQEQIQKILSAGGSINPNQLLFDLLAREPNQDAFLKVFGLK